MSNQCNHVTSNWQLVYRCEDCGGIIPRVGMSEKDIIEFKEQAITRLKLKMERQSREITSLLDGKTRRKKYIKDLHQMLNRIGWCHRCDTKMVRIWSYQSEGWHCEECGRTIIN